MWQALVVVMVALVASGAALKAWGRYQRWRARARLADAPVLRSTFGVTLRVLVGGTAVLPGMRPRRANRTTGDLLMTADRFLVPCNRGVLIDLSRHEGRLFRSARCTGPGKLVIEGDVARPSGPPVEFRVEVGGLVDAPAWAEEMQGWVRQPGGAEGSASSSA